MSGRENGKLWNCTMVPFDLANKKLWNPTHLTCLHCAEDRAAGLAELQQGGVAAGALPRHGDHGGVRHQEAGRGEGGHRGQQGSVISV